MSEQKCTGCDGLGVVLEFRPGGHPDDACEKEVDCPDCQGLGVNEDDSDDLESPLAAPASTPIDDRLDRSDLL